MVEENLLIEIPIFIGFWPKMKLKGDRLDCQPNGGSARAGHSVRSAPKSFRGRSARLKSSETPTTKLNGPHRQECRAFGDRPVSAGEFGYKRAAECDWNTAGVAERGLGHGGRGQFILHRAALVSAAGGHLPKGLRVTALRAAPEAPAVWRKRLPARLTGA